MTMRVYPKTDHLRFSMKAASLIGMFPTDLMFTGNKTYQRIYHYWYSGILFYFTTFLATAYVKLILLLQDEKINMTDVAENLCITLLYTNSLIRQMIMKFNKGFRSMLQQILNTEQEIQDTKDEKRIELLNECSNDSNFHCKLYLIIVFTTAFLYVTKPLFHEGHPTVINNVTYNVRPLPLSSWMPVDRRINFKLAYMFQIIDCAIGAQVLVYTDLVMFSLILFPTGQLKIMGYLLRHYQQYKQQVKERFNIENDERVALITFKAFVLEHRKVIDYVNQFNDTMSTLTTFDFLQSSLQIASIVIQTMGNTLTLWYVLYSSSFFVGMFYRLILYYYFPNEIIILSDDLTTAVWESDWYNEKQTVKTMMHIFMLRTQRSLKLFIGPFGVMSIDAFISILKATYSYIMLMYGVH